MNEVFREYTTSTAFMLALSKGQCHVLLTEAAADPERKGYPLGALVPGVVFSMGTLRSLESRGLVAWHHEASGRACGFAGLTKAGWLVVDLLIEAGMTLENTITLSTRRAREQWGVPVAANAA